MDVLLKVEDMRKDFGATRALAGVHLELRRGEVHGLVGENGSGKSTLSNIIAGVYRPSGGSMSLDGAAYSPQSVLAASRAGVSLLAQETGTIAGMSVYENMFLGEETAPGRGLVSVGRLKRETRRILDENGLEGIDVERDAAEYSFEQRKMLEVARAVAHSPQLLIVDETTTALSHRGRQKIYEVIRAMREDKRSVIFISHDLDEILDVCDRVTILRDGQYIATLERAELEKERLRSLMIGREFDGVYYRTDAGGGASGEAALSASGISLDGVLAGVSLTLRRGEILGVGGLTESGMHELGKILFGALRPDSGEVLSASGARIRSTLDAVREGIAYIPKDRDTESLFISANIRDNIAAASYDRLRRGAYIPPKAERAMAEELAGRLQVKMRSVAQQLGELSGGNKQKVAICKWLARGSDVFIMDCPTRGIDVGVKAAIYRLMEEIREKGGAILMISEELTELIGMSDRILVLKDGALSGEFLRADAPGEQDIIRLML